MKDIYIDYGNYRNPKKGSGLRAVIILLVVVAIAGIGGYFGADYYFKLMAEQDATGQTEAVDGTAGSLQEGAAAGIGELWYPASNDSAEETTIAYDVDKDIWMGDFVDNRTRVEVKGLYLPYNFMLGRFDAVIKLLDESEVNALVIDVKTENGLTTFDLKSETANAIGANANIMDVTDTMKTLKEHNVYCIARIAAMMDEKFAKAYPEYAVCRKDGSLMRDSSGKYWLNPYKDGVWDYLIELGKKCAEAGFDEINYDYIRFSTDKAMNEVDFSLETRSRQDAITDGIKRICEELKPLGVFVSCDVYGAIITSSVDSKIVGQNYFRMAQYLDYICPMIYPSHYGAGYYNLDVPDAHPYDLVYHALLDSNRVLYMIDDTGNKAKVRPWLQDFTATWVKGHIEYGAEEIKAQKQGVYDSGHKEWLLWNAAAKYTEKGLDRK